jgi:hypothetical protein
VSREGRREYSVLGTCAFYKVIMLVMLVFGDFTVSHAVSTNFWKIRLLLNKSNPIFFGRVV